jgi:2-polyprenyl-6-methoxyphenol hydroxylase-like FAD-dependent oxidoreductase
MHSLRLAGEWLHPTGAGILTELGVELPTANVECALGRGFAIFPKRAEPIVLPYVGGELGVGCQHHLLVEVLQNKLKSHPGVTVLKGYRAVEAARGTVTAVTSDRSRVVRVAAATVVGADGRQSIVRQALGYSGSARPLSYMVGVLIDSAALPVADYGNVLLGGPGPVLAFRVGPERARVCIDVPADRVAWVRNPTELIAAYRPTLPGALADAITDALATGPPSVAANQLLRRRQYGRDGVALVGDAVGHCHPLCAVGMTVGFLDAVALAGARSVEEYAANRSAAGRVPELLSTGLYDLFAKTDAGSTELRDAVYHLWRTSAAARHDTMRLLAVRDTRRCALGVTFARLLATASCRVVFGVCDRPVSHTLAAAVGFGRWTTWFARESLTDRER